MITVNGERWGTAADIAVALGGDVTPGMVRKWASRDGLASKRVSRTVYYPYAEAAEIEAAKRAGGRGRPRQLDFALVGA